VSRRQQHAWWALLRAALPLATKPRLTLEEVAVLAVLDITAPDDVARDAIAQLRRSIDEHPARAYGVEREVAEAFEETRRHPGLLHEAAPPDLLPARPPRDAARQAGRRRRKPPRRAPGPRWPYLGA
jgi:hypothetical protein